MAKNPLTDLLNSIQPGGQSSATRPKPSAGVPLNSITTYQPGSATNSGSTPQQSQTPQQIIQNATGGFSGGLTTLPQQQNQTRLPQTGQQAVQSIVGNMAPNQGTTFNPNQPFVTQGSPISSIIANQPQGGFTYAPPPLSREQSAGTARSFGLQGIADGRFTGMTQDQADAAATDLQAKLKAQISAGTSYSYNPATIAGTTRTIGDLKTKVDSINNDAWSSQQDKKTNVQTTINSNASAIAKNFTSMEDFQNAVAASPELQKSLSDYTKMGGNISSIENAIQVTGYRDNSDGTTTNFLSDGTRSNGRLTSNADGSYSFNEVDNGFQTLDQFLGRVSTPSEKQAYQSLIPEQKSLQAQIAFENGIVDKYHKYYFGDENQIGLLQQQKQQAVEKATILDQQAKLAEDNAKASADLQVQKNQAELDGELATVEENRLTAKNYMTGLLAKLGALNTTGAAGEALVNVEAKYQKQAQSLRSSYSLRASEIKAKMNETVNNLESDKMEKIFKVKEDLSKNEQDVIKEVFKLETEATRKSFDAVDKYLGMYRTQKDKYVKEAKDAAEKAAKAAADAMSSYNLAGLSFDKFGKTTAGQTYAGDTSNPLVNAVIGNRNQAVQSNYLSELKNSGALSPETQAVISGEKSLMDLTEGGRKLATKELKTLGINQNMLPKTTDKTKEFGALSSDNLSKGLDYLYQNGATPEEVNRFKTDRAAQAYIMGKI